MTQDSSAGEAAPRLLRADNFEPLVGRDVRFGETGMTLRLVQVERQRSAVPADAPREPFLLIFSGPRGDSYLREGLYGCDFGTGDVIDIHVAPINTPAADRQDYQAVFN